MLPVSVTAPVLLSVTLRPVLVMLPAAMSKAPVFFKLMAFAELLVAAKLLIALPVPVSVIPESAVAVSVFAPIYPPDCSLITLPALLACSVTFPVVKM